MLHTWQKFYNLRRNEENLAAKLLKISGEILTAKLKDLGANLIIDLSKHTLHLSLSTLGTPMAPGALWQTGLSFW